jgi:hypothetical protein
MHSESSSVCPRCSRPSRFPRSLLHRAQVLPQSVLESVIEVMVSIPSMIPLVMQGNSFSPSDMFLYIDYVIVHGGSQTIQWAMTRTKAMATLKEATVLRGIITSPEPGVDPGYVGARYVESAGLARPAAPAITNTIFVPKAICVKALGYYSSGHLNSNDR